jgi:hypothetical protein
MTGAPVTDLPTSVADFAVQAIEAGVIPELTDYQVAFLEALAGDRPMTLVPHAARRGGRRHLRAIVAAYFLAKGEAIIFVGDDPERGRQDALEILDGIGITPPRLTHAHSDEIPVRSTTQGGRAA